MGIFINIYLCAVNSNAMLQKKVSDSATTFTEIVMPNDTNPMHNLMGGNLLKWMDIACGICGSKHANRIVVTAAVDNVSFNRPIKIGDIVTIHAQVTRAFNTSMEIYVEVSKENFRSHERVKCNEAFYTFVALDDDGRPVASPEIVPENEEERSRYDSAMRRRELRHCRICHRICIFGRISDGIGRFRLGLFLPLVHCRRHLRRHRPDQRRRRSFCPSPHHTIGTCSRL